LKKVSDPQGPIAQLLEVGRAAWPEVAVDGEAFVAHVAARLPDPGADPSALHAADLYLAFACGAGDARALAAFESRHLVEVPLFLAGVERAAADIEEVKQLLRERLFVASDEGAPPKILDYSGRGALGSWLRVVALRVASNRRRALHAGGADRHRPFDDERDAASMLPSVDPELAIIKTRYKAELAAALREAFEHLTPRERLVFRMHFVDGLNIDRIGLVFQVHRATVARWIAAGRERLLARTMEGLGAKLRLVPSELESLVRVVQSSIDVSLFALLADRA
jgi:RNA polymerase sigma-70 factor (ECF subfamily)